MQTTCDEALPIAPRECARYADDQGTCVDCWGDDGALVSHQCTQAEAPLACHRAVQGDGRSCWTCSDENGVEAVHQCDVVSRTEQCDVLQFSSGTCTLCVDGANNPTYFACDDGAAAARDVQECFFSNDDDRALCVNCPVPESDTLSERACMGEPVLSCVLDANAPDNEEGAGVGQAPSECLQCTGPAGAADEVCGYSLPPACERDVDANQEPCARCTNVNTGVVVYDDCQ